MPIDAGVLAAIGVHVGLQIKNEVMDGIGEVRNQLTDADLATLANAAEALGDLTEDGFAGRDVSADMAVVRGTFAQYKDVGAQILKRVSKERIEAIGMDILKGVVAAGEAILKGFLPIP